LITVRFTQLATPDVQPTIGTNVIDRPDPKVALDKDILQPASNLLTFSPSSISTSATLSISTPSSFSRNKGLQLGANKVPGSVVSAALAAQLAEEIAAEDGVDANPWGTDDLIDINADEEDWSKSHEMVFNNTYNMISYARCFRKCSRARGGTIQYYLRHHAR
jgi:SCY1-like protein 1